MYPGTYQYKLIIDGNWTYSADHFTVQDGSSINNLLEVGAICKENVSSINDLLVGALLKEQMVMLLLTI